MQHPTQHLTQHPNEVRQPQLRNSIFGRLLNSIGIETGPSKVEQQRAFALQKQQEAMRIAHEDHRARVQALNVSRGALQDGGQFTVPPDQFYNVMMVSPTEQDERAARMAEARKMTDEESNGSIAYATPVSNNPLLNGLMYVNANFEDGFFTEYNNKYSYEGDQDRVKIDFHGMPHYVEKRGPFYDNIEGFNDPTRNFDENMECKCTNGVCSCTVTASKHTKIPLNGGTISSSIDSSQTISGLNIVDNVVVKNENENDEKDKKKAVTEEFISVGNNEIKTSIFLQILMCLGIIYVLWMCTK